MAMLSIDGANDIRQFRIRIRFEDGREAEFLQSDVAAVRKPKWYLLGTRGALVAHWREVTRQRTVMVPVTHIETRQREAWRTEWQQVQRERTVMDNASHRLPHPHLLAHPGRLELPTCGLEDRCSIHLATGLASVIVSLG